MLSRVYIHLNLLFMTNFYLNCVLVSVLDSCMVDHEFDTHSTQSMKLIFTVSHIHWKLKR
jgi:hypothetical protein